MTVTKTDAGVELPFGYLLKKSGIDNGYYFISHTEYAHVEERFREMYKPIFLAASPEAGMKEATAAQHFNLPKGTAAQFVRNGILETCQCSDCVWNHELRAFDRTFAVLASLPASGSGK